MAMDSFDQAFLIMTGRVKLIPALQSLANIFKATGEFVLWGPQSRLLHIVLNRGWKNNGGPELMEDIVAAFDLSGDISINLKDLKAAMKVKRLRKLGRAMWKDIGDGAVEVDSKTITKAEAYFTKQQEEAAKADVSNEFVETYLSASEARLAAFVSEFPEGQLASQVQGVVEITRQKVTDRTVDKAALTRRIKVLEKYPNKYWKEMSDIEVGRTWNHTGIRVAADEKVVAYQVISERDKQVCPICNRVDGHVFRVAPQVKKMNQYIAAEGDTDKINNLYSFPRIDDVDNISPEQMTKLDLMPPFHGRCRCDVVMLWR
jgi:hypothetical protein